MSEQISEHKIRVYEVLKQYSGWLTSNDIAVRAGVAKRTARMHAAALATGGIFEREELFGGFRYRFNAKAGREEPAYVSKLEAAKHIMGVSL